jgi:beta-phosphoglucomutase family hydrolase
MKLEIPAGEFAGYIFDLDGTLVDTMPLHYRAWDAAMRAAGLRCTLDEDLFYSLGGVPTKRVAELIAEHYGLTINPMAVFHHKESLFTELQADAKLIEPVASFARRVAATHPVAIASGGPRVIVQRSLELAGLAPLFKVVVTADDVVHGKPSPDMFLLAARQMKVPPEKCLVFEDAEPGMRAADAAGMQWVRVPSRTRPADATHPLEIKLKAPKPRSAAG